MSPVQLEKGGKTDHIGKTLCSKGRRDAPTWQPHLNRTATHSWWRGRQNPRRRRQRHFRLRKFLSDPVRSRGDPVLRETSRESWHRNRRPKEGRGRTQCRPGGGRQNTPVTASPRPSLAFKTAAELGPGSQRRGRRMPGHKTRLSHRRKGPNNFLIISWLILKQGGSSTEKMPS